MTAETDLARRARQVTVACQEIETALARRPGALPPNEHRDVLDMLRTAMGGVSTLVFAGPVQQCDAAENLLGLWRSMLSDETDLLWSDDDDEE